MEFSAACGSAAPCVDEESVDIYEGLDLGSNPERSPSGSSGLKDSMDLYEDLVAEERLHRETSHTELESRLEAAQKQIQELHRRLKQMEVQITGLSTENNRLKKNISSLLRTARQEVLRKDAEIQRLTQGTLGFHHYHRPQMKSIKDPNVSDHISSTRAPPPQSKEKPPAADASQPSIKETCDFSRSINPSSALRPKRQQEATEKQTEPERLKSRDKEEKHENHKLPEAADGRLRNCSHHRKESEHKQAHKEDRESRAHGYRGPRDWNGQTAERRCRSDGAAASSPPYTAASSDSRKEERKAQSSEKAHMVSLELHKVPDYRPGRSCTTEYRKTPKNHRYDRRSSSKDKRSSSPDQSSKRCDDGAKSRETDRQRGADRRCTSEASRRHRRRSSQRETDREQRKHRCKEGRRERNPKAARSSPDEPPAAANISVDHNSNRKLCFMETLNLTLSPIKRPSLPRDSSPDRHVGADSPPDMEDMCVIDQVDGSELEAGHAVDRSTEEPPTNQKISNECDEEDVRVDPRKEEEHRGKRAQDPAEGEQTGPQRTRSPSTNRAEQAQLEVTGRQQLSSTSPSIFVQTPEQEHGADLPAAVVAPEEPPVSPAAALPPPEDRRDSEDVMEETAGEDQQCQRAVSPGSSQQGLCLPSSTSAAEQKDPPGQQETTDDWDPVSSSVCLNTLPQGGSGLKDAIHLTTPTDVDGSDGGAATSGASVSCVGVSKVSSTTEETPRTPRVTPQKMSSSVALPPDEDSMMHTLNNLKRIPDAISPLRSPVQTAKRGVLHVHGKLGHVKSLQKDFSATVAETNSKKLDVNKENKYPGPPTHRDEKKAVNTAPEQTSSPFSTELEEGEILSDGDEANISKRAKLTEPARNKPGSTSLRKKPEERRVASKEAQGSSAVSTHSPRSRFKTVCPAASKASFSTVEEIMETFKLVRTEMRKKYMKLHKTFPKKSFCGVMDNFQKSFLEFVDGAQFDQICSDAQELKSKLRKLIASVFSKMLNNGIVKRIFEQQAANLKQKLWDFVDVQVEYLFIDIHTALKSLCQPVRTPPEDKRSAPVGAEPQQAPVNKQSERPPPQSSLSPAVPYRTGLGSRGKDIRMSHTEPDPTPNTHPPETSVDFNPPTPSDRHKTCPMVIAQNGSMLDKTDFELLTEQQASSLTFNLVRDSQMGEIFKCLLQGSDLLESTGLPGDGASWSIGTPRKDGERFLGFATPSKPDASARLIATWSSISPRKRSSPCPKDHTPLNPALLDESCLLEVPSGTRSLLQSSLAADRSYSILAEDLAVSLTIPSPLKSDSHLSFLQPADTGTQMMSTPDSVLSAHISEDALLDGEDATEQDIHLALDNSSCSSRESTASEAAALGFKPDAPMQALVMEKSNDHFVVKIRQISVAAETTLIAEDSLSQTLMEQGQSSGCMLEPSLAPPSHQPEPPGASAVTPAEDSLRPTSPGSHSVTGGDQTELRVEVTPPKGRQEPGGLLYDSGRDEANVSESERSLTIDTGSSSEKPPRGCDPLRKRKRCQDKLRAKRFKEEKLPPPALSPSSLSAKNIIRKKGEVVMAWTREEDRSILMYLKTKGASRETFSTLSEKLNKPSEQVAHRFYQLMKLFKKQEKMDT